MESTSKPVASRFVSENDLEQAQAVRESEWKKAYERLGQEPPPMPDQQAYDGRTLFEQLQEHKDAKQAEFEDKIRFANQFRALDEEETAFLGAMADEARAAEKDRRKEIEGEVAQFKELVANRKAELSKPDVAPPTEEPIPRSTIATAAKPSKSNFNQRSFLAGAIKKKSTPKSKPLPPSNGPEKRKNLSEGHENEDVAPKKAKSDPKS